MLFWSTLTYRNPANDRHVDRLSKYKPYDNEFYFKEISNLPMHIQDIYKFKSKYIIKIFYFNK